MELVPLKVDSGVHVEDAGELRSAALDDGALLNRSGMWNATALKIIEKYPMLVIEKWHCQGPLSSQPYAPPSTEPCSKLTQEARMIG